MIARWIAFTLRNQALVLVAMAALLCAGAYAIVRIPVDAIPDVGERQVVVFADWPGRSPQVVEDQVTYPLSVGLTGTPGVKSIRGMSAFGFAMVFLVFQDDVDASWARSRVLERLSSAAAALPQGVDARLGPDATGLGQVYMYTLEGQGFDLGELRTCQDWYVRYALQSVEGVAEVASVGGFVKEYQVDLDPERLRAFGVAPGAVADAVRASHSESGGKVVEGNGIESFVRGAGYVRSTDDLESVVLRSRGGSALRVRDVATVQIGPEFRRGALDNAGTETVGGIVAIRQGENPRDVVARVKERIREIEPGLPSKVLEDGRVARVVLKPFYDRTTVIDETIDTLTTALLEELAVTALVVFAFLLHLRTSLAIVCTMPLALAVAFVGMWWLGIDANIMSLAGIAIAIGDVSDMGIIMAENIFRHLTKAPPGKSRLEVVYEGAAEVGDAIWGAVSNTIVSFLPVFALTDQEGKLFSPLAYTKSFAILASFVLAVTVVPIACFHLLRQGRPKRSVWIPAAVAVAILTAAAARFVLPIERSTSGEPHGWILACGVGVMGGILCAVALRERMRPAEENPSSRAIRAVYEPALRWVLAHKALFLTLPSTLVVLGLLVWLGFDRIFDPALRGLASIGLDVRASRPAVALRHAFPGLGREFMPPLDEGSFLFMPSLLPAASLTEALDVAATQDRAFATIPEVDRVVGKVGRSDSPLDPAPVSMLETVVTLKPESQWRRVTVERFWSSWPEWLQPAASLFAPAERRITKEEIRAELARAAEVPGVLPSWLQPIQTRLVMLQSGFRANVGVKIYGSSLEEIEAVALAMERILRDVPGAVDVVADRIVGKPTLDFRIDRDALARHGASVEDVQRAIELGIGGERVATTVEGRERYPIRLRYAVDARATREDLERIPVFTGSGAAYPIGSLAPLEVRLGPSEIKSENGRLVGYVTLNARGRDEVSVVEDGQSHLTEAVRRGDLVVPAGVHWTWAGQFENQVRSTKRLALLVPLCLVLDLVLLYLSFRKAWVAILCFSAIPISASGGFLLLELWGVNLSVAVWVGFIALFGVAEDDAVVLSSYMHQLFDERKPATIEAIRDTVVEAGLKRIRPCLMTTATTVLGLVPVFTTTGRGSDVMQPMAIPSVGGMFVQLVTLFVTPCITCAVEEWRLRRRLAKA